MKTNLPPGYHARPARIEDVDAAVEMFNLDSRRLIGADEFILHEEANEWQTPGFDLATDSMVVLTEDDQLVAYYRVWDMKPHLTLSVWGRVHPAHLNRGIASYLLEWARERACQSVPKATPGARVIMQSFVNILNQDALKLFEEAGMQHTRDFHHMVIDLDAPPPEPQWPPGIEVRTLVLDRDEWPLSLAMVEAFKDHWGFVDRPIEEDHERWMHIVRNNEDFDPSLCYLAWDGDQLAGASICWPYAHEDRGMGWVDELGVRRPWRNRGLGLALLHHSFGEFYRRGKHSVGLGVDAENLTGALRLYERAGMHSDPDRRYAVFELELRPGEDLRTK
jgi:mycothiol synthase